MKATIQIQDISAAVGTKAQGFLTVAGTNVRIPVVIINGAKEGTTLLVTAGIHGGEYPSIEAAIRFGQELDPAQVSGAVIVMSPVSLNAFHARQAFLVPEDGKNLNRVFPGKAAGTISERMAHTIMNDVVPHIQAWIDMHGGDIPEALVPFGGYIIGQDEKVNQQARAMSAAFGLKYLLHPSGLPGTSISSATSMGIPAILVEAGQLGILDEENTQLLLQGCRNVAQCLNLLPGTVTPTKQIEYMNFPWVRSEHTGCWYPQVKLGDTVEKGQLVGIVKDYFGEVLGEYKAVESGLVLLVCAAMSVSVNDPLVGVGSQQVI